MLGGSLEMDHMVDLIIELIVCMTDAEGYSEVSLPETENSTRDKQIVLHRRTFQPSANVPFDEHNGLYHRLLLLVLSYIELERKKVNNR